MATLRLVNHPGTIRLAKWDVGFDDKTCLQGDSLFAGEPVSRPGMVFIFLYHFQLIASAMSLALGPLGETERPVGLFQKES